MRTPTIVSVIAITALLCASQRSLAAPFVNLDFEQSTVQMSDGIVVSASAAFPGWTAQIGGVTQTAVYHDYPGAGEPVVSLYDEENTFAAFRLLQGNYMAYLAPGTSELRTSLSQIGDIPVGTQSLTLLCDGGAGPPVLIIDDTIVQMVYQSGINFNHFVDSYGADISAYADHTVELRFQSGPRQEQYHGGRGLDDIRFSADPLPEPNAVALCLGAIAMLNRRRSRNPGS